MTYSVTLSIQLTPDYTACPASPVRLTMTVTSVVGFLDQGIFVFLRDTVTHFPYYSRVSTPCDINTLPFNGGAETYRGNAIDLVFLSAAQADAAIATIEGAIQELCNQMNRLATLAAPVTLTITNA